MGTFLPRCLLALLASFCACSAGAAPPLAAYAGNPEVEMMVLSPGGVRYAFVQTVGEERILRVSQAGAGSLFAAKVDDQKVRDIDWADEDHVLVTVSSTFKAPLEFRYPMELEAVIAVDLRTRKALQVFGGKRLYFSAVTGYYGSARVDGTTWGYFGGITDDDFYSDLYRVDLDTGKIEMLDKADGYDYDWVIGPDGEVLAHSEYSDDSGRFRVYAGTVRKELLFERADPLRQVGIVGLGSVPRSLVIVDNTSGGGELLELTLDDRRVAPICREIGVIDYSRDGHDGRLLGCISGRPRDTLLFDPDHQARYNGAIAAFPGRSMRLESQSGGFRRQLVFTQGGDDSGTYWLVDIETRKASPLGMIHPQITAADVGATSWFDYGAADGLALQAVLTLPPGREPRGLPVVVMPHGGPIGVYDEPGFDWWAQAFAAQGYAVLQPNYRGSGGYTLAFENAGRGEMGGKMLSDVADGLRELAAKGVVDLKRACIVGGSYGGYAALAGVTLQQGLYRCAVSVAGIADLSRFYRWATRNGNVDVAERHWRSVYGIDRPGDPKVGEWSPARVADRADAPILLIHGKDDTVVPLEQSRLMEKALKKAGKPVEFELMDGEDHWLSREATRTRMLERSVAFVMKNNPPR